MCFRLNGWRKEWKEKRREKKRGGKGDEREERERERDDREKLAFTVTQAIPATPAVRWSGHTCSTWRDWPKNTAHQCNFTLVQLTVFHASVGRCLVFTFFLLLHLVSSLLLLECWLVYLCSTWYVHYIIDRAASHTMRIHLSILLLVLFLTSFSFSFSSSSSLSFSQSSAIERHISTRLMANETPFLTH